MNDVSDELQWRRDERVQPPVLEYADMAVHGLVARDNDWRMKSFWGRETRLEDPTVLFTLTADYSHYSGT